MVAVPIARRDFVACYQTGPQAASYVDWQHAALFLCSSCDCVFLCLNMRICLLVCLIALLVYLVGWFVGYLVGWLGLRSPVCLLVGLFVYALLGEYLLYYFVSFWGLCIFSFGAVPPNFRHGGGPGAARAYDI